MKQYFFKGLVVTCFAVASVPAMAQKEKDKSDKKEHQTIIIHRNGDIDQKTTIEVIGDKVLVDGKEPGKNSNVSVDVSTVKPGSFHKIQNSAGGNTWIYDGNGRSLFTVDSNRAMLGVITDMHPKGALIDSVSKESPAEKAGLKKGDVITKIGTRKVEGAEDVTKAIRAHKPGDKVDIAVLRNDKEQVIKAELGMWKGMKIGPMTAPKINVDDINVTLPRGNVIRDFYTPQPKLGMSVQDTEDGRGVKVTEVDTDSYAAKAGMKVDDIITHIDEKAVNSADETAKVVRANKEKALMKMQILRSGKPMHIDVRIPRKLKTADL